MRPSGGHEGIGDVLLAVECLRPPRRFLADRSRLVRNSIFFNGLLGEDALVAAGDCTVLVVAPALSNLGRESSEFDRAPRFEVPAPGELELLLPYLFSGDVDDLFAAGKDALLEDGRVMRHIANAHFLGVSNTSLLTTNFVIPHWRQLTRCAAFQPRYYHTEMLHSFFRELLVRADAVSFEPENDAASLRIILDWASRGGWTGAQHTELRQLVLDYGQLGPAFKSVLNLNMVLTTDYPAALIDAAIPATLLIHALQCAKCEHCGCTYPAFLRDAPACCRRTHHSGEYSLFQRGRVADSGGWSCCGQVRKDSCPCSTRFFRHSDARITLQFVFV
jgi:hypothetical protein